MSTEKSSATKQKKSAKPYELDAIRTMVLDYPDQKVKLEYSFAKETDERDFVQYYLAAPSFRANSRGESRQVGQPDTPAAALHDVTCVGLRRLAKDGTLEKEYSLEEVRGLRPSSKVESVLSYLGGYYDVELKSESGDIDDILFDRSNRIVATVKVRPDGRKVAHTFDIYLNRPDDLTMNRFTNHSQSVSAVDPKRDEILADFVGDEELANMTGDEDEGDRVSFTKTTQYVRHFFAIFKQAFDGFGEGAVFSGKAYEPAERNTIVGKIDNVLKIAIAAELRNFF